MIPLAIDPYGCACPDCGSGRHVPLQDADPEWIALGLTSLASVKLWCGVGFRLTASYDIDNLGTVYGSTLSVITATPIITDTTPHRTEVSALSWDLPLKHFQMFDVALNFRRRA